MYIRILLMLYILHVNIQHCYFDWFLNEHSVIKPPLKDSVRYKEQVSDGLMS